MTDRIQHYLHRRLGGQRGWPPQPFVQEDYEHPLLKKEGRTMSTKGMQWSSKTVDKGKKILLYNDAQRIVLQLRHQIETEDDIITPSFRVAVSLSRRNRCACSGPSSRCITTA